MKKSLFTALFWLAATSVALCQGTIPVALSQQVDGNGRPLVSAILQTYVPGTVAQQLTTFQDVALTIPNPWPLVADQNGRIPFFYLPSGSVHARLLDASGNVQFDIASMLVIGPAGGGGGGGGSVDPTTVLTTGDLKPRYGTGILSGFVRANALTIGNATSGATERANADTQSLFIYLYNTDPNLTVSGGRTGNALNDYNSNKTIATPDWRGRALAALDDMGNSPAGKLTNSAAGCGTSAIVLGAGCGNESVSLTAPQLPANIPQNLGFTFTPTSGTGALFAGTGHSISNATGGAGADIPTPTTSFVLGGGISITSGQINAGGGAAHPTVTPLRLATIYIKL